MFQTEAASQQTEQDTGKIAHLLSKVGDVNLIQKKLHKNKIYEHKNFFSLLTKTI